MAKLRIGVLVSGGGTNLQAIIDAIARGELPAEIAVVVSNVPTAYALQRAEKHGIPHVVVDHRNYPSPLVSSDQKGEGGGLDRKAFEQALIAELDSRQVELICLAGFMRVLSPFLVQRYAARIMNIHPALLPAFKGLWGHHVHEAVLASGARFSGCTVHFVTEDVDGGPIIVQRVVPVLDDDSVDTLADRVLEQEHKAYPEAIRMFAEGRQEVVGKRVIVR